MEVYINQSLTVSSLEAGSYHFKGSLDHYFMAGDLPPLSSEQIKLDLSDLDLINSCGVREILPWLNKLPPTSQVRYINCPIFFVNQANMIKGIVNDKRKIETFYAPYYDESLDKALSILLNCSEVKDCKAPVQKGPGQGIVFDSIEEKYFNFLKLQNS